MRSYGCELPRPNQRFRRGMRTDDLFKNKRAKERYLNNLYKAVIENEFQELIVQRKIKPNDVEQINFYIDTCFMTIAGQKELREMLERELRQLFSNLRKIKIEYCNSKSNSLIRASDVIANRILSATRENAYLYLKVKNLNLLRYPNIN